MPTRDDYVGETWRACLMRLRGVRPLRDAFLVRKGEPGGYTTSDRFVIAARYGSIVVDPNSAFDVRDPSYFIVFRAMDEEPPKEYKTQWTISWISFAETGLWNTVLQSHWTWGNTASWSFLYLKQSQTGRHLGSKE